MLGSYFRAEQNEKLSYLSQAQCFYVKIKEEDIYSCSHLHCAKAAQRCYLSFIAVPANGKFSLSRKVINFFEAHFPSLVNGNNQSDIVPTILALGRQSSRIALDLRPTRTTYIVSSGQTEQYIKALSQKTDSRQTNTLGDNNLRPTSLIEVL